MKLTDPTWISVWLKYFTFHCSIHLMVWWHCQCEIRRVYSSHFKDGHLARKGSQQVLVRKVYSAAEWLPNVHPLFIWIWKMVSMHGCWKSINKKLCGFLVVRCFDTVQNIGLGIVSGFTNSIVIVTNSITNSNKRHVLEFIISVAVVK